MPLPPSRKAGLRAGRQMQVDLFEIPFTGAPEILCRERFQTVPYGVRRNKPAPCFDTGKGERDRWAFFNSLSWTPHDVLRPKAIRAGGVPPPASLIAFAEVATFAQVAVRTRREMESPHLAAKTHIFLRHPDF